MIQIQDKKRPPLEVKIRVDSSISPEKQLIAELKLAIMLGKLQPGETLPSVREMAAATGLGRNVVWRAYSKLARMGVVKIQQRRRAVVASDGATKKAAELVAVYEWLGGEVLERARSLRINAQSFIRFLDHRIHESGLTAKDIAFVECSKVHARSWSEDISKLWGVAVAGYDIKSLQAMPKEELLQFKSVLTPLVHHDEVREIFEKAYSHVVPLKFCWDEELIRELRSLPDRSVMAMIFGEHGYPDPWERELRALCPNLVIEVISFESTNQLKRILTSNRYAKVHLSGSVLDDAYEEIRTSPLFVQQPLQIDSRSLEEARIQAGVVL